METIKASGFRELIAATRAAHRSAKKKTGDLHKWAQPVLETLSAALAEGEIAPMDSVPATAILEQMRIMGVPDLPRKSNTIGDGCHALGLMKAKDGGWIIPFEMPVLGEDSIITPAIYEKPQEVATEQSIQPVEEPVLNG